MTRLTNKPGDGSIIANDGGQVDPSYQVFFDELEQELNANLLGNQVQLASYTVATLPSAATAGGIIYVSDETGGAVPAFSDGTNWRRVTDRTVVS
jgi:hypothetical protein